MKSKNVKTLGFTFVLVMLFQFAVATGANAITTGDSISPAATGDATILVLTQNVNGAFEIRIELDSTYNKKANGRFNITYGIESNYTQLDLNQFQTIIVNSFLPENLTFISYLADNVSAGAGLFFFGGYYPTLTHSTIGPILKAILPVEFNEPFTIEEETYIDQSWVGQIELKVNEDYKYSSGDTDFKLLQRSVVWESSPLVKERIFVKDKKAGASVLVYRPENEDSRVNKGYTFTKGEPLVTYGEYGSGKVVFVSMGVGKIFASFLEYETIAIGPFWNRTAIPGTSENHTIEWNKPFYLWPYFNFFIYQTTMFLSNFTSDQIDTYAKWDYSPIPHELEATLWMIFVAGLWVFNFVLFFTLGRKKKREGLPSGESGGEGDGESGGEGDGESGGEGDGEGEGEGEGAPAKPEEPDGADGVDGDSKEIPIPDEEVASELHEAKIEVEKSLNTTKEGSSDES
ncbi:MAG: hypothetical protein ACTSUE_02120 [Promethearchaeota archaeon]